MARQRKYTDEQLSRAIAASHSWRESLRALGLASSSSGAMRSVRAQADRLGIDYGHFDRQRRWTGEALRRAVADAGNWADVVDRLQLDGTSAIATVKGHAARLGLDTSHLQPSRRAAEQIPSRPVTDHLHRAGSLLAAAWYTLCGLEVAWPLEPSRYDLLVSTGTAVRRVQVKTTTTRVGSTWKVYLSTSRRARRTYDPDEIDEFFVIDGDLGHYAIPVAAVGGLHAIHLSAYDRYRVARQPSALPRD